MNRLGLASFLRCRGYNPRVMASRKQTNPATSRVAIRAARRASFALAASLGVILCGQPEWRGRRGGAASYARQVSAAVPTGAGDAATPRVVASPPLAAARCRARSQPIIASVANLERLHTVGVSRIGGLYGP